LYEKHSDQNSFTFRFASRLPPLFPIFLEGEISSSVLFGIFLQASLIEKQAQNYVMHSVKYLSRNRIDIIVKFPDSLGFFAILPMVF